MMIKKWRALTIVICFMLSACERAGGGAEVVAQKIIPFTHCENTFVVSGFRKIYLFEHQPDKVNFKQLAFFKDWAPYSPFLDCDNNRIVVPYGAREGDSDADGVAIIDLHTGTKVDYPVGVKGIQGIPIRYRNGILLDTGLLQRAEITPDSDYIPWREIRTDKSGKTYRIYTSTMFFDLDKLQFTRELDIDKLYGVLTGELLTSIQRGAITEINLQTRKSRVLYKSPPRDSRDDSKRMPRYSLNVFSDGNYYVVTNRRSHNGPSDSSLIGYENNAIYQLVDGAMVKLVNIPYSDATYLLGLDKKLYIFTQSFKVIEFDTVSKTMLEHDLLDSVTSSDYRIDSVGYTQHNFVIAMSDYKQNLSSKVMLVSRDFKHVSAMHTVRIGIIDITTNMAIDTNSSRGVRLPERADREHPLDHQHGDGSRRH